MIWTVDLTSSGYLITWSKPCGLPDGAVVGFYYGLDPDNMTQLFTSSDAVGSEVIDILSSSISDPNASARMDILVDDAAVETGPTRPLIPGFTSRDVSLLRKLAEDHRRRVRLLRGYEGSLYRKYTTGTACPDCTDPSTGARLRQSCSTCDGSGTVVGWDGPYSVYVRWMKHRGTNVTGSGAGTVHEAVTDVIQMDAIPRPRSNDRLVLPGGRLYILGQPQITVAGVAGIPAVIECPVKQPGPDSPATSVIDAWLS